MQCISLIYNVDIIDSGAVFKILNLNSPIKDIGVIIGLLLSSFSILVMGVLIPFSETFAILPLL